jgi:hypothetical protein
LFSVSVLELLSTFSLIIRCTWSAHRCKSSQCSLSKANSGSADDMCWCVCLSARGIEEFEMVLWLRGSRRHGKQVFVVVGGRCGAMAGVNLEVRF